MWAPACRPCTLSGCCLCACCAPACCPCPPRIGCLLGLAPGSLPACLLVQMSLRVTCPCRPGGMPHLLQHHPAHQWPAATPQVGPYLHAEYVGRLCGASGNARGEKGGSLHALPPAPAAADTTRLPPPACALPCPPCSCRTCRKRFHGGCLYKWFKSSGKSNCPHCQSPW